MQSWLKTVRSFGATLYRTARSKPVRALLVVALIGVIAVTGLNLIQAHRPVPLPGGSRLAIDEEREKLERMVASRRLVSPSPPQPANATDPVSDGWGRRIIRHATLDVELADVEQGVSRLTGVVESVGGFISSTDSQVDQKGTARATITAYVPPAQFAKVLGGLDGVGRVTRRQIGGEDGRAEVGHPEGRGPHPTRPASQPPRLQGKGPK